MFVLIYQPSPDKQRKYIGPFVTYAAAYDALSSYPAPAQGGVKYIVETIAPEPR